MGDNDWGMYCLDNIAKGLYLISSQKNVKGLGADEVSSEEYTTG